MKYIASLLLAAVLGCASHPVDSVSQDRAPANSGGTELPFGAAVPSVLYQGPLVVNTNGSTRAPGKAYLPIQYDATKSWPLVVMLHGFSGNADTEDSYLTMRFRVSTRGFILLDPQGTSTPKGTHGKDGVDLSGNPFWNATDACCDFGKTGVDDVGYIMGLISEMKRSYNIDPARVYIIGHSNGGFMANRLGCEEGDSFAGIVSIAGGTYLDPKKCAKPTPVNYLQVHAVDDKTILYEKSTEYAGGKETVAQWLVENGCTGSPTQGPQKDFLILAHGPDTTQQIWQKCQSGKDVAFWTIKAHTGKGHSPHVPFFHLNFMDNVLDFLFQHSN